MALRSDQLEVAKRLLGILREGSIAGLQAPTGWGKSYTTAYVIKELGGKWLWSSSLINALVQASNALRNFNVKHFLSTGRERLCLRGFRHSDFIIRRPCNHCPFNTQAPQGMIKALLGAVDYPEVRDLAEEGGLCPYNIQEALIRELLSKYDDVVVLMNYGRLGKYTKRVNGLIIDEAHNAVIPRLVSLPRRVIEQLLNRLGIEGIDVRNAEVVKGILSEYLLAIAVDNETSELVSLDDVVTLTESQVTYYDNDEDALVGVRFEGLPQLNGKRVVFMSATLPPSLLQSVPTIKVPSNQVIRARVGDMVMTTENTERFRDQITNHLRNLISDKQTVIFTTSSKEINLDNAVYEDELRNEDLCRRNVVLHYYGKYAEGVRLNCYSRAILLTLPLLPSNVMRRLEARGLRTIDLIVMKTVQAIGRLLPNEEVEVILLDKRFKQYCSELINYGIQCLDSG